MSAIVALHGWVAILLLCGLIFAEESGVPLPLLPGDLVLVTGGILIGSGNVNPTVYFPAVLLAALAGALVGHTWAHAAGLGGLTPLARRIGAQGALERASHRLKSTGPVGIFIARLIPGLRVFTTLVAGALGVPRTTFFLGLLPATVVWLGLFTGLGVAAGLPLLHLLGSFDHRLVQGLILVIAGALVWLVVGRMPLRSEAGLTAGALSRPWRLAGALSIDLGVVGCIVVGLDSIILVAAHFAVIDGLPDAAASVIVTTLIYVFITRYQAGATAGEAIFGVSHLRPRHKL